MPFSSTPLSTPPSPLGLFTYAAPVLLGELRTTLHQLSGSPALGPSAVAGATNVPALGRAVSVTSPSDLLLLGANVTVSWSLSNALVPTLGPYMTSVGYEVQVWVLVASGGDDPFAPLPDASPSASPTASPSPAGNRRRLGNSRALDAAPGSSYTSIFSGPAAVGAEGGFGGVSALGDPIFAPSGLPLALQAGPGQVASPYTIINTTSAAVAGASQTSGGSWAAVKVVSISGQYAWTAGAAAQSAQGVFMPYAVNFNLGTGGNGTIAPLPVFNPVTNTTSLPTLPAGSVRLAFIRVVQWAINPDGSTPIIDVASGPVFGLGGPANTTAPFAAACSRALAATQPLNGTALPSCPLNTALLTPSAWSLEPECNLYNSSSLQGGFGVLHASNISPGGRVVPDFAPSAAAGGPSRVNCGMHTGNARAGEKSAAMCVRSNGPLLNTSSSSGGGTLPPIAECCYSAPSSSSGGGSGAGQLITAGLGAGRATRFNPSVNFWGFASGDVLPLVACCQMSGSTTNNAGAAVGGGGGCASYLSLHPASNASAPVIGASRTFGDPHFVSRSGAYVYIVCVLFIEGEREKSLCSIGRVVLSII